MFNDHIGLKTHGGAFFNVARDDEPRDFEIPTQIPSESALTSSPMYGHYSNSTMYRNYASFRLGKLSNGGVRRSRRSRPPCRVRGTKPPRTVDEEINDGGPISNEIDDGGSTISICGGTTSNEIHGDNEPRCLEILHRHAALEAVYDSTESFAQPRCHPETRAELLDGLWHWIQEPETRVLWLHGPAGAGKSAVMQTLSQRLQDAGQLGGSFFFKRGDPTRGSGRVLFATLAYQLALFDRVLGIRISEIVETNPSLVATSIPSQLQELVAKPCLSAERRTPRVLLVDGLDECDAIAVQQDILRSIFQIFREHSLPVKILIASRPKTHIRRLFDANLFAGLYTQNIEQSFSDVKSFLRQEFSRIHIEHGTRCSGHIGPEIVGIPYLCIHSLHWIP
ncbi:hypothetical protein FB45DRAFT_824785 [Roridomyces roridus]|uniref:NACHT domain-containing protein n=1 Tax=Roridomyces roridus TaxID=1738132 RepID=A0AAD7CCK6_9AGAR|nr:hypothetical protein FB45DRAFT_824785 [Roridomyces roridus]